MNNISNEVRLLGRLKSVSLTERRLWALLITGGPYSEWVPIIVFAAKDEDVNNFAARMAVLTEGTTIAVQGRLSLSRELDEHQRPVVHPRTGHPLKRAEVIVSAFATFDEIAASSTPQASGAASAAPPAPRRAPVPSPAPRAKASGLPPPARAMPAPRVSAPAPAASPLGTPAVPWS